MQRKELEALCVERDIPSKPGQKAALLYILESHDSIREVIEHERENGPALIVAIRETEEETERYLEENARM